MLGIAILLSYLGNRKRGQSCKQINIWKTIKHWNPCTYSNAMSDWALSPLHFYITEQSCTSADGNLRALTRWTLAHWILCRSETLVACCRGNAAWIHMITFLINFPIPIATICPLLHTMLLKEKILSSMNRKLCVFQIIFCFMPLR